MLANKLSRNVVHIVVSFNYPEMLTNKLKHNVVHIGESFNYSEILANTGCPWIRQQTFDPLPKKLAHEIWIAI